MVRSFGDFEFDDQRRCLSSARRRVRMSGQALDLLSLLVERPGDLITREEIQRRLWPDSTVEFDHSLDVTVSRLRAIGIWLRNNGDAVYATQRCRFPHGNIGAYTRKGNTLYTAIYFWPGRTMTIGGVRFKVQSARFLATGAPVRFMQRGSQLIFLDLPAKAPDDPVTVIAVECDSEPIQHALSSKADAPT